MNDMSVSLTDQPVPRIRMSSEHWNYKDFDKGEISRRTCYVTENCDDAAIERLLEIVEPRRYGNTGKRLKSRTFKRFDRYPDRIAVTAIYEVNP